MEQFVMSIRFIAIVDSANAPVYIQSFGDDRKPTEPVLEHQFIAEMTLDYVDVQLNRPNRPNVSTLLLVHNGIAVYGALTNTNIKFFIGLDAWGEQIDLAQTMKELQDAYIGHLCNPFYNPSKPKVESVKFQRKVQRILAA